MGNPELVRVKNDVAAYSRDYPFALQKPGLMLIGDPGTGKTHLAVAALKALLARGHEGLFCDYQSLLDRIRSGYDASSGASDREAYRYLPASSESFLYAEELADQMSSVGFYRVGYRRLMFGTIAIHWGEKDQSAG